MTSELPQLAGFELVPLLNSAFEGIAVVAPPDWQVIYANRTLSDWVGRSVTEIHGLPIEELIRYRSRTAIREKLEAFLVSEESTATESVTLQRDGVGARDVSARFCHIVVTEQRLIGIVLQRPAASHFEGTSGLRRDPLTQLPDRTFLMSRLSKLLEGDRAADQKFAVLFVDLDNFKRINDEFGHLLGDRVLREVAGRLRNCIREGDHVTRFGGDEFVVLLEHVEKLHEVDPVIARIHDAFARPIVLSEGAFRLSLSIGAALASAHHHSAEDILLDADRQMYAAKRAAI